MKIEDREITPTTKLANLLRSGGVLLPKYLDFFWNALFMCKFEKQEDTWEDFKKVLLCKAPKTRGRELISKAGFISPLGSKRPSFTNLTF